MKRIRSLFLAAIVVCVSGLANAADGYLLTAAEAGARAVRYSVELQSAYADLRLQYAALGLDVRKFLPALSFDFGNNDTVRTQNADSRLMSVSATLTQPLWDGGKALTAYTRKRIELEQALRRLDTKARATREKAIELYYAVLIGEKKAGLKAQLLELAHEQLLMLEQEVALGVTTEFEYRKAQGTYRTLILEQRSLEISVKLDRLELGRITNLGNAFLVENKAADVQPMPGLSLELLVARALRASPELNEISWKIKTLNSEMASLRWSLIPSVSLVAVFSTSTDELPFSEYTWSLGLQFGFSSGLVSVNSGIRYGKTSSNDTQFIEQSGSGAPLTDVSAFLQPSYYENALKEAALQMDALRKDIRSNVEEALERYKLACEQRELANETVKLSREQYELVMLQKQLGLVKQLDVMNAALAMEEKHLDSVDADYAILKAEREIERLTLLEPGQLRALFAGE